MLEYLKASEKQIQNYLTNLQMWY